MERLTELVKSSILFIVWIVLVLIIIITAGIVVVLATVINLLEGDKHEIYKKEKS